MARLLTKYDTNGHMCKQCLDTTGQRRRKHALQAPVLPLKALVGTWYLCDICDAPEINGAPGIPTWLR
jgi:hypothetical protein